MFAFVGSSPAVSKAQLVAQRQSAAGFSTGQPRIVLGLGDSVTAGTACDCLDFITHYADIVSAQSARAWVGVNLGVPGSTSTDLEADLDKSVPVRDAVRRASTVIITIGANDLGPDLRQWNDDGCDESCYGPDIAAMGARVSHILGQIRTLRGDQRTRIMVTNYWNVFTDGAVARETGGEEQLSWSDRVTRQANEALCAAAHAAGASCVDLYTAFKGAGDRDPTGLLADDGDHPNATGSEKITAALLAARARHVCRVADCPQR